MLLLNPRATITTTGALLLLASVAWLVTGRQLSGRAMAMDLTAPVFMAMWLTMMVAMMFPTIAPMVLAHRMVVLKRGEGLRPTVAFVLGYLAIWTLIGFVPLSGLMIYQHLPQGLADARWAGVVLVIAGVYQFTAWKRACLRTCRTPLDFVLSHDFGSGSAGAFRVGISHGLFCLGCCWALMTVLVLIGLMSLGWMAAVATIFLLEKNLRYGMQLTRLVGATVIGLGLAVVLGGPEVLSWLSGPFLPPSLGGYI